jgi:NADP-dependent 3-hydroxy acid dehydrogenase YdfG
MNIAITGTTRGIGQALASSLGLEHKILHINRPEYDLSDLELLSKIDFSSVDVLILNAGVLDKDIINSPFECQDLNKWKYILNCNLIGNLFLVQQYIKARSNGVVIFMSGATVTRRKEGSTTLIHALSKKAMSSFIEDIRYEIHQQRKHIRFVDIKPGLTRKNKSMIDSTLRIPTSYDEVVKGIIFALENPAILNIDFEKHEPLAESAV